MALYNIIYTINPFKIHSTVVGRLDNGFGTACRRAPRSGLITDGQRWRLCMYKRWVARCARLHSSSSTYNNNSTYDSTDAYIIIIVVAMPRWQCWNSGWNAYRRRQPYQWNIVRTLYLYLYYMCVTRDHVKYNIIIILALVCVYYIIGGSSRVYAVVTT